MYILDICLWYDLGGILLEGSTVHGVVELSQHLKPLTPPPGEHSGEWCGVLRRNLPDVAIYPAVSGASQGAMDHIHHTRYQIHGCFPIFVCGGLSHLNLFNIFNIFVSFTFSNILLYHTC